MVHFVRLLKYLSDFQFHYNTLDEIQEKILQVGWSGLKLYGP